MYHLRTKHCEQFAQYKAAANDKASTSKGKDSTLGSKQLTLEESADKCRKWDISDVRAQAVHRKIGEMIALDDHPFSIVDDGGFVSLLKVLEPRYNIPSRKYFTDTVIPKICDDVKCTVVKEIANASHISLTTDIWSTDLNSCSLLSLTAHWLTPQFERKSAMLHAQPFDGSHTGEAICTSINQMLQLWELSKDRIHLLIRDNAANMVKGITDAGLPHIGCFAHTLQLVIHDAILSQRAVSDMLATSRRIIGHFRRSNLAYTRLKDIQKNLGLPVHRLVQDEPTRWNSTLYMLQRIIEQKMALAAYATEYGIPQLTSHQVTLANKVVKVMTPIEEVTMSISADAAARFCHNSICSYNLKIFESKRRG